MHNFDPKLQKQKWVCIVHVNKFCEELLACISEVQNL